VRVCVSCNSSRYLLAGYFPIRSTSHVVGGHCVPLLIHSVFVSFVLTLNPRPLNFPGLPFVRFATLHHLFCYTAGSPSKFSNYLDTHLNLKRKGSFVLFFLPKSSLFFSVDYLVRSPYHFKCCATLGRTLTRRFSGGFFTWVALLFFFSNMG
jgi:hypothetical protein